jgi:hypothetical protein
MVSLDEINIKFYNNEENILCDICGKKKASYKCKICNRNVCEDDFYKEEGICKICAISLCQICKTRLSVTYCQYCGRLVCTEDSIQLDNVRRICIDCYNKKKHQDIITNKEYIQGAIRLAKRIIKL